MVGYFSHLQKERENSDDEPNYEDILRCLDRWIMDGLRDGDILDEWTNGERRDTTFPFNFGPVQDQLTMAHVVTFTTMERRINFTWNRDITFLLLGVIGGEVEEAVGGLYFYLFSPFRFPREKLLILPTLDSRCFFVLGPPAGDRERQRESRLWPMRRGKGDFFFPPNKSDRVR